MSPQVPWELLISKLQRSDCATVTLDELHNAGSSAEALVQERLVEYARHDAYVPDGCDRACLPNLQFEARRRDGLVGVACPHEDPCWAGWKYVPRAAVGLLRCRDRAILERLGKLHALEPCSEEVAAPFLPLGIARRRGLRVAVVWLRHEPLGAELLGLGLKQQLGCDALVVLTGSRPRARADASSRVFFVELPPSSAGKLPLGEVVDLLTPDYRERVLAEPALDLDYVRLRFATVPGDRHVVEINGEDFGGFRQSDVKFLRLLLLAVARKCGISDGWLDKSALRDGDDKDRALERIREDLVQHEVRGLPGPERRALVRGAGGRLRLGVPPENIELDASLTHFEFMATRGSRELTQKQREGLTNAKLLLKDARKLGLPGPT